MTLAKKSWQILFPPESRTREQTTRWVGDPLAYIAALHEGGKAGCALRVGGHLCELSFVRFISHKQISGVVYLYRKRANNAPGTRRSRVLESSTFLTISLALPQSPLLWPPLPPASRTVLTFFPAFFFCFFFHQLTTLRKKIYLTFPLQ